MSASSASPRRTASRHASTAPSCDPTWRWIPRARSGPSAGERGDGGRQLGLGHAELGRPRADGEAGVRLGRDVRVEAEQDVERRPAARAQPGAAWPARRAPRAPRGSRRRPSAAGRRRRAARTAARRSAAFLPIPSSVIRSFGRPAARAAAHSPRRDDVRVEAERAEAGDDRRDVVRLDRERAQPRVGEGVAELRRRRREGRDR